MIAFLRLALVGLIVMSIFYVVISIYSRSVRREKLEKQWDENAPPGADAAARRAYIEDGLREYRSSLRRKLIILVYVVPSLLVLVLLYLVNFY